MSLRSKVLLSFVFSSFLLILVIYFGLSAVLMRGFYHLEEQAMIQNVELVRDALDKEISNLSRLTADWSMWDDSYRFVEDENQAYVTSNLVPSTYSGLDLDFIVYVNIHGRPVYAGAYDETSDEVTPLSPGLLDSLLADETLMRAKETGEASDGVWSKDAVSALVSSQPILTSEEEGPIRGLLVFGRYVDPDMTGRLGQLTHQQLQIIALEKATLSGQDRATAAQLTSSAPVEVQPLDENRVAGYGLIDDIHQEPCLMLKVERQREIVQQGQVSVDYGVGGLILATLASIGIAWLLLEQQILSRLSRLATQVKDIGRRGDSSRRVQLRGSDELAALAENINVMLASLEDAQQAAQASRERHEIMARIVSEHTYLAQVRDGAEAEIVWTSPGVMELTGLNPADIVHPNWKRLVVDEDWQLFVDHRRRLRSGQQDAAVFRLRDTGGQIHWVRSYGYPVRDESDGHTVRIYGALQDVTHEKQAEEDRQVMHRLYLQAQKMEAVGNLTAGIAHDFNNVLTAINGFAELLQSQLPADSPQYDMAVRIANAGRRAADLIHQLLLFSRKQPTQHQAIDLNKEISRMEGMIDRLIPEDIELVLDLAAGLWPIDGDPTQLEQVVLNLTVNARDAMPDGGTLTIRGANVTAEELKDKAVGKSVSGDYVLLTVTDSGVGMSQALRAHIFEPFFTTKGEGKGTGLGLATVHHIVDENHGIVDVDSSEGRGTTFRIYWPRTQRDSSVKPARTLGPDEITGRGETILVVEDDDQVCLATERILQHAGYQVLTTGDGLQAIETMRGQSSEVDLLLTDLVMPVMRGRQLADRLTADHPQLKVVFMTGYVEQATRELAEAYPNAPVVTKPFTPETLLRAVRRALDEPPR